jgi:hypothetical protein
MKRNVVSEQSTSNGKLELTKSTALQMHSILIKDDSSQIETEVQLKPNGKFTYSIEKGFEGEASGVRIFQKAKASSKQLYDQTLNEQSEMHLNVEHSQKQKLKSIKSSRISFVWMGIILVLLVGGYLLGRKLTRVSV